MILGCPNCGARFRVAADELGPSGRRLVRCARCRHEWTATVNDLAPEPPAGTAKPRRAAPSAKPKATRAPKPAAAPPPPAPPPPLPAAATKPEPAPPPLVESPPEVPSSLASMPPPTTEAAEDARLQADASAAPVGSPFEDMLAKAVAPSLRKPAAPSRLKSLNPKRLAVAAGWVLLVVLVGALAVVAFEHEAVMGALPGTKPVYAFLGFDLPPPGDGLRLTNVNSTRTTTDGVPALVIEGKVTNTTDAARPVPAMRGSLRDAQDQELQSWVFTADTAKLAAGESTSFKTEVKQPSPRATGLSISFTAETK